MDSPFEQYSITFDIKEDKVDIFKTIVRFLDYLTRHFNCKPQFCCCLLQFILNLKEASLYEIR